MVRPLARARRADLVIDHPGEQDNLGLTEFGGLYFIGEASFSAPDQARLVHSGGDTIVRINTVGNSGAEMEIELTGAIELQDADF